MEILLEEGKEIDFEEVMEQLEEKEEEKIRVVPIGNQKIRVICGNAWVEGRLRMTHGAIIDSQKLSAAKSVVYDDSDDKIEAKLSTESVHFFIQLECIDSWNGEGDVNRENLKNTTTHSKVLNSFSEFVGKYNGIIQTRAEVEKKKKRKLKK